MSSTSLPEVRGDIPQENCISLANRLIMLCGMDVPPVSSVNNMQSRFFMELFKKVFGLPIPELISCPVGIEDEVHNIQAIVDTLSLDILSISLSHITGEDIIAGNLNALHDLLEIFEGYVVHCVPSISQSAAVVEKDKEQKEVVSKSSDSEETSSIFICGLCGYRRIPGVQPQPVSGYPNEFGPAASCPICSNQGSQQKTSVFEDVAEVQKKPSSLSSNGSLPDAVLQDYLGLEKVDFRLQTASEEFSVPVSEDNLAEERHSQHSVPPMSLTGTAEEEHGLDSQQYIHPTEDVYQDTQATEADGEGVHLNSQKSDIKTDMIHAAKETQPEQLVEKETQTSDLSRPSKKPDSNLKHHKQRRPVGPFPYAEQDEVPELYSKNLEARVRNFLEERTHHKQQAAQIKKVYLQSLKKPYRKPISPLCRKSFLLPYYLRRRSCYTSPKKRLDRPVSKSLNKPPNNLTGVSNLLPEDATFLKEIREAFPSVHLSPSTVRHMTQQYEKHLHSMQKDIQDALLSKSRTQILAEEAVKRQKIVHNILKKEIQQKQYLSDETEHRTLEQKVKAKQRDTRLDSAKMKQYYDEFYEDMKRKLQKGNYREEQLVKNVFEERLNLEKEQIRMLRQQLQEKQQKEAERYRIYLDALENFYQTQFAMLAESLAIEKHDMVERTKAQKRVLSIMKRDFHSRMKEELRRMQEQIVQASEDIHFREMDAERYTEHLRDTFSAHPLNKI